MATPTHEELLQGATQWRKTHMGVAFLMMHHGYRAPEPDSRSYLDREGHPGIWCYYLLIPEQMYPHRWEDFRVTRGEYGPAFDSDMFDSEITFQSSEPYWCRRTERMWDAAKVGCDYAHLWHRERGYPDTYESVQRDAKRTVELFLDRNPDRHLRCEYSGVWGPPDQFYTARNGRTVHVSRRGTFTEKWNVNWEPRAQDTETACQ